MRVKFSIDSNNNINILDEDQDDTFVRVIQDGDLKVVTVSAPDTNMSLEKIVNDYPDQEGGY